MRSHPIPLGSSDLLHSFPKAALLSETLCLIIVNELLEWEKQNWEADSLISYGESNNESSGEYHFQTWEKFAWKTIIISFLILNYSWFTKLC